MLRTIKSFVRRQRRLSQREQQALITAWPSCGIVADHPLDLNHLFHRDAPKICEIGFGHGDTLLPMAIANADKDYLGIEVHVPGVAAVMSGILEHHLSNIRVIQNDAVIVLRDYLPDHIFSRIHIFFPDPWHKSRHHKRRLIQDEFVDLLIRKLTPGGVLHLATDWEDYAKQMMRVLSSKTALINSAGVNQFSNNQQLQLRAHTKFENRGLKLGHGVWDVVFTSSSQSTHPPPALTNN